MYKLYLPILWFICYESLIETQLLFDLKSPNSEILRSRWGCLAHGLGWPLHNHDTAMSMLSTVVTNTAQSHPVQQEHQKTLLTCWIKALLSSFCFFVEYFHSNGWELKTRNYNLEARQNYLYTWQVSQILV